MPYDAIVVGAGPAGLSAATYLVQHRWRVLVLDGGWKETQLSSRGKLGLLPGTFKLSADEISRDFRKYYEDSGGIFDESYVQKIVINGKSKQITTKRGDSYSTRAVVVTSGLKPQGNWYQGERRFFGRGLSYDLANIDLHGKRNAVVIGKSPQAVDAVLRLSEFIPDVTFVIPANRLDVGDDRWQEIKSKRPKLKTLFSASLKELKGSDHLEGITIFATGKEEIIPTEAVILYSHDFKPQTEFLPATVKVAENGEIMVDDSLATSEAGIFAAGDILCNTPQISIISSAQGVIAGQSAENFLMEE